MKRKNRNLTKCIISFVLTVAMALGAMPMPGASLTALAENVGSYNDYLVTTDANMDKSGDDLTALQVTFNDLPWYIIEDNSTSATTGSVTLLAADTSFGVSLFGSSSNYSTSTVKQYLDNVVAGTAGSGKPDFKNVISAIRLTNNGRLYLLSSEEAKGLSQNVLGLEFTNSNSGTGAWWLRSQGTGGSNFVAYVSGSNGQVYSYGAKNTQNFLSYGVRPALQLNLSYVNFDSTNRVFEISNDGPIYVPNDDPNLIAGLWSGEMSVYDDLIIDHDVFLDSDTTLTVVDGKILTVYGSVVSDYNESDGEFTSTLTIKGTGKVIIAAPDTTITPGSGENSGNGTVDEVAGKVSMAATKVGIVANRIQSNVARYTPASITVNAKAVEYYYGKNIIDYTDTKEKVEAVAGKVKNVAGKVGDAAGKIENAAGEVRDAAGKVKEGAGKVKDAAGKVKEGAGKVADAAGKVMSGAEAGNVSVASIHTQSAEETWSVRENAGIYCNVVLAGGELKSCNYFGNVALSDGLTYSADLGQLTDTSYTAEQASMQLAGKLLSTKEALKIEGLWVGDSDEVKTTGVIQKTESLGRATVSIEEESLVLTLEDFSYVGTGHEGDVQAGSIYYNGAVPLIIRLYGTNIIENTAGNSNNGIYIEEASCSVSGDGMLMVISGEASEGTSNAITANKGLTINSGLVYALAGQTDHDASRGINCISGGIIINGGTLLAQGDNDSEGSNGVCVDGSDSVVINGGSLFAIGEGCGIDTNTSKILLNGGSVYSSGYDAADGITVGAGLTYTDGTTSFSAGDISDISGLAQKDLRIADEASLKKLLSASETLEVILEDDYITTSSIEIKGTKTLDLNGHGIRMTGSDSVIKLVQTSGNGSLGKGASLTLTDSNPKAVHYITLSEGRGVAVSDSGEESEDCKKITGGYITGGSGYNEGRDILACGGGVYLGNGSFTMNGGMIIGNSAGSGDDIYFAYGGGVYVKGGLFTMNGGRVFGNVANGKSEAYGGVYVSGGLFTMNDGEVSYNRASTGEDSSATACGGVYLANGSFTMNGGEISGNSASCENKAYGGVFVNPRAIFNVSNDAKVSGNTVQDTESNVYVLDEYHTNVLTVTGALTDRADIHVAYKTGVIAKGGSYTMTDLDAARFVCDDDHYAPKLSKNSNQIYMVEVSHTVSVADGIEHGTVSAPGKVADGGAVVLAITPDSNYDIDTVSYNDGSSDHMITPDSEGRYIFTMPECDVTVSASFTHSHIHSFTYTVSEDGKTITAECINNEGNCRLTDRKATLTVSAPVNLTYNGNNKEVSILKSSEVFDTLEVVYAKEGDDTFGGKPKDAGTYTASISVGEGSNKKTVSVSYTIAPKEVNLTWNNTEFTYDGETHKPSVTVRGLIGTDHCDVSVSGEEKNVGTYTATASDLTNSNYKLPASPTTEFFITQAEATVSANNASKIYGEEDPELSATVTGAVPGETIHYTLTRAAGENAGKYTITVTPGENPNYLVTTVNGEFTIEQVLSYDITYAWSNDGKSCTAEAVSADDSGHTVSENAVVKGVVTTPATCKDMGVTTYTATFTNMLFTTQTKEVTDVEKLSTHMPAAAVSENSIPATCETDGSYDEVIRCSVCGIVISSNTIPVSALGHDWGEWVKTKDPSETETGLYTRTCRRDPEHTETREIPVSTHEHVFAPVNEVPASCTADGSKAYYKCTNGCDLKFSEADATKVILDEASLVITGGHKGGTATCCHKAVCDVCREEYGNLDPANHEGETEVRGKVDKNCTEDGYSGDIHCKACGALIEEGKTVKASGHIPADAVKENEIQALCDKAGSYDEVEKCSVCGEELSRKTVVVDALGHDYETPTYEWSADGKSCTATRKCSRCEKAETESAIVTSVVKTDATTEKMVITTYTATFKNTAFKTQTKDVEDIPVKLNDKSAPEPVPGKKGDVIKDPVSKAEFVITSDSEKNLTAEYSCPTDKSAKSVTVPDTVTVGGKTYKITSVKTDAFKDSNATTVTIGKNITKLYPGAFNGSKVKTIIIKSKKLKKKTVKKSVKGCKAKKVTVEVKVGSKKLNKNYVKKYKKYFTKKNVGKKVTVK